jgi:hypothetical protein
MVTFLQPGLPHFFPLSPLLLLETEDGDEAVVDVVVARLLAAVVVMTRGPPLLWPLSPSSGESLPRIMTPF